MKMFIIRILAASLFVVLTAARCGGDATAEAGAKKEDAAAAAAKSDEGAKDDKAADADEPGLEE